MKVKFLILTIVLLLSAQLSLAKTQTIKLDKGQSTVIEGINVTLMDFVKKDKKALVCVNDEKAIISDDKRVNGVYFEVSSFKRGDGVKFVLDADCDDCIESDNSKCFSKKSNDLELYDDETEDELENELENELELEDEADDQAGSDENSKENEDESGEIKTTEKKYQGILQRLVNWVISIFS